METKKKAALIILPVIIAVISVLILSAFPAGISACETGTEIIVEKPKAEEKPEEKTYDKNPSGFTEMLYNELLGREAAGSEINYWQKGLSAGTFSPSFMLSSFLLGQEGQKKYGSYDDSKFIGFLYEFVLKREPDTEGYNAWLSMMSSGAKRDEIINSFTSSQEFINIWNEYGIIK